ncbi:putative C6 transcription factor [Penicillium brasilianum]|uniref:Putative C6 transcription factor n=1 Tax=Penicillium brasilianum TaxID=104259 RepID=A0A1S9S1X0_PENBI|nr:putative C6 transcription factor [Penicillium brasilianum]
MTMEEPLPNPPGEGLAPQNGTAKPEVEQDNVPPPKPASSVAESLGSRSQAKVAIPRSRGGIIPRYNRRVPRACESCRARKTKCSGDTPVCRQCRELRITCNYPVGWKERTKRQVDNLSEKAQEYENLLKELGHLVESRTADRIRSLLDKHGTEVDYSSNSNSNQSHSVTPQDYPPEDDIDEMSSPSSIGSLEAIDRVEEDLNRNEKSRATGFMGKNSEVTWMQRLQREAEHRSRGLPGSLEPGQSKRQDDDLALHAVSYHLDDLDISLPGPIELYSMPPRNVADKLFDDYLRTVHPFFPIINRPLFAAQYRTFFDSNARPGDKWLAILNMIFAIAAKHAHLIEAPWQGDDRDHLVYLTRARILSMNGDVLFSHPDLQQVQVEGLIAFYLLASDQINRAWRISSLAVRSAITLGINMKSSSATTPNISKEARYRVWWCLYTFEHMLGVMTGRATCILDGICTTPLPLPFEEEQLQEPQAAEVLNNTHIRDERINAVMASAWVRHIPLNPTGGKPATHLSRKRDNSWVRSIPFNSGLCHLYYCDLAVVVQEIVNKVYSVDCVVVPWKHIENRIGELRSRIDLWFQSIPTFLDFTRKEDEGPELLRCKLALAFHYYSARITLGRPCLCRRDAQKKNPADRTSFSHEMAILTLESAERMLDLIPDEPNAVQLYEISPWWCILHYLMQAVTVLLLELSFGTVHAPDSEKQFLLLAKKGIRWLYSMSEHSIASRRAWQLCDISLRRLASGMSFDVSDIPTNTYHPTPTSTLSHPENQNMSQDTTQETNDYWGPALEHLSLSNHTQETNQHSNIDHHYSSFPSFSNMSTTDPMAVLQTAAPPTDDLYFPYDPISGEFIRSFFPNSNEEGNWDLN